MKSNLRSYLALAVASAAIATAQTVTLTSYFDDQGFVLNSPRATDFDHLAGYATMSFTASSFTDGTYNFDDFANLDFYIQFNHGVTFARSDLQTNTANLDIVIRGTTFQFYGASDGISNGSTTWASGGGNSYLLSTNPSQYPGFGYMLRDVSLDQVTHSGSFGVGVLSSVPEPSTYAAFAGLATLGFAVCRRRGKDVDASSGGSLSGR